MSRRTFAEVRLEGAREAVERGVGICWIGTCMQSAMALTPTGWPVCHEHGAQLIDALAEAIKDVCWRATQYGQTEDGDVFAYIVTKGAPHRLVGAAQCAGISASLRANATTHLADDLFADRLRDRAARIEAQP